MSLSAGVIYSSAYNSGCSLSD